MNLTGGQLIIKWELRSQMHAESPFHLTMPWSCDGPGSAIEFLDHHSSGRLNAGPKTKRATSGDWWPEVRSQ